MKNNNFLVAKYNNWKIFISFKKKAETNKYKSCLLNKLYIPYDTGLLFHVKNI